MDTTPGNMHLGGQLTQEKIHSSPMVVDDSRRLTVGHINNDFDVDEFEWEEEEQEEEEEERIGDVVSNDSYDSNDE